MDTHITIHPASGTIAPLPSAAAIIRVLVSPHSATDTPYVTLYCRDVAAARDAYGHIEPHLADLHQATIDVTASQPTLRYPLAVFQSVNDHLKILAAMGVSRIALPFIAENMRKAITRSRQAHDSMAMGQWIISHLESSPGNQPH